MALVHWKEPRIWSVTWPGICDDPAKGKHFADSHNILPGVQHIDDEVWETMKAKVPDVKERLESGQLVEVKDEKAAKGKTESGLPKTLDKFSATDAIELVGGIMDKDILNSWGKAEKRATVKDAIKAQLKSLEPDEEEKK